MTSSNQLVIETQPISEETKLFAIRELRETPEIVEQGLRELRSLLASDTSFHYDTEDEFLTIFLRPCKYYAKSAFKLMKRIADYRAKYKHIFANPTPEKLKDACLSNDIFNGLIDRDQKGRRILISRSGNWDPSKITTDQLLQITYLIQFFSILEPETQVRGFVVIVDCHGLGMKQIRAFTPSFAVKLLTFIQYALPLRLKEIHIINNSFIFDIAWKIFKPLLQEKSAERVFFHGNDITSLHKFILPSHLPEDFGGSLPKIWYGGKEWHPILAEHTNFIKKWNSCGRT